MGPLVGVSFISAVRTYGEASGLNGTAAGVGEAFSPLVGIWAPTFSACELAAAFLLPFVAIRLVSGDRQSGALKLELQHPMPAFARIGAKALVLLARMARRVAGARWRRGAVEAATAAASIAPELATVALGHVLNAGLTIALAAAAAAVTDHPSTAAILTLSVDRRHMDHQLRRGRAGRHGGSARPATRRRPWSPSFSMAWSGWTSSSSRSC